MEDVKILRVELKGKKYLVYSSVDDDPVKVTEDTIVNHKLFKGTVLSSELWDKIKNGNDESLLFDKALNHIDYKPRTTKEIKDFLKKKEATVDVIERIIERLISMYLTSILLMSLRRSSTELLSTLLVEHLLG